MGGFFRIELADHFKAAANVSLTDFESPYRLNVSS